VNRQLTDNPAAFDFFAAVRLLERAAENAALANRPKARPQTAVGEDSPPRQEAVRFRSEPSLTFSVGDVARVRESKESGNGQPLRTEMSVNFLGLTGPNGALPQHYTTLMLSRLRERDFSLREFFDLFHHRSISLYYRAWEKYRLPFLYERARRTGNDHDLVTLCLYALIGLGTDGLRGRRSFDDRVPLFFAGTFSRQQRPALELQRILRHQFHVPVEIRQFFGRWLTLDDSQLSCLAGGPRQTEQHNRLGENVVIGRRVVDVQNSFRIVLGPMQYEQFRRFTPAGSDLKTVCELTRSFVGPEFEFDVQVVLSPRQTPQCRLDSGSDDGSRLGWNTWLHAEEMDYDVADTVFLLSDI